MTYIMSCVWLDYMVKCFQCKNCVGSSPKTKKCVASFLVPGDRIMSKEVDCFTTIDFFHFLWYYYSQGGDAVFSYPTVVIIPKQMWKVRHKLESFQFGMITKPSTIIKTIHKISLHNVNIYISTSGMSCCSILKHCRYDEITILLNARGQAYIPTWNRTLRSPLFRSSRAKFRVI